MKKHQGEKILIVGHSAALASLFSKWCKIEVLKKVNFQDITSSNVDKDDYCLFKTRKIKK